jgi:hypothetical protein
MNKSKNPAEANEDSKQNTENARINLDDYAGDEEDNRIAKTQSNNYIKALEGKENDQVEQSDSNE